MPGVAQQAEDRQRHRLDVARRHDGAGDAVPHDLAVAADGTIYITDSAKEGQAGALYRISAKGKVSAWVTRNDALEKPNGIAVLPDGTIVHGGRGVNLVFRDTSGRILREREAWLRSLDRKYGIVR